jgi:hypothetical protein
MWGVSEVKSSNSRVTYGVNQRGLYIKWAVFEVKFFPSCSLLAPPPIFCGHSQSL